MFGLSLTKTVEAAEKEAAAERIERAKIGNEFNSIKAQLLSVQKEREDYRARCDAATKRIEELAHRRNELQGEVAKAQAEVVNGRRFENPSIGRIRAEVERILMDKEDVRYHLGSIEPGDAKWGAIRKYMVAQLEAEADAAYAPGLSDGERQFATGRAAGVEGLILAITGTMEVARAENSARKEAA